jgi:hypothetical protein
MTIKEFMIGPIGEGLRKDLKPFATPEDSFETLVNAYQFRGRIVRRSGYTLLGRLANNTPVMGLRTREIFGVNVQDLIAFDTTQAYRYDSGSATFVSLPSVMPVTWSGTDSQFFYTINYAGAFWTTNSKPGLNGIAISNAVAGAGFTTITTSSPHGFTSGQTVTIINITSTATGGVDDLNGNTYVITVTGASTFTIPFQTTNVYSSGGLALNSFVSIAGQDGIRYYGVLTNGTGWANYNPPLDPNNALAGALLIFPYRGYLVFLNTTEGNDAGVQNFGNRARWTQIGTPYYSQPVPVTPNLQTADFKTARDDLFGRGGANDAPTQEVIVGAGFIRDVLIVYFERSTWRLRFVNNAQNPFVWERINVELGASSPFSTIPFDKGLMAIGNRGIVISDANDVIRFDEKIPNDIFDIREANNGNNRVYGIRTFETRLTYWTIPSVVNSTGIYPDLVLVYNYDTKNWAYFDDCFTCFGYFYPSNSNAGDTWNSLVDPWSSYGNRSSQIQGVAAGQETIVAGNQQGFVLLLDQTNGPNSASLFILSIAGNLLTSTNHNLQPGYWISLSGVTGTTSDDGVSLNGRNFQIVNPTNAVSTFGLTEFEPVLAGNAIGATFSTVINFVPILSGSVQINVGTIVFTDPNLDGILTSNVANTVGTINYKTGQISLTFNPVLGVSTAVYVRVVSVNPDQKIVPVNLTGAYGGGGLITKISGIDIQTKIFNFFKEDQRARLSKIDFYTDLTEAGQFTVNVFPDSSNLSANAPLPDNLQSNVLLTSANPYQIGSGDQSINRLFCDVIAQSLQIQITLSDQQMAVNRINSENIEILSMIFTMRKGGRLV